MFSNTHKHVLSIVGQHIGEGMAQAMSSVFTRAIVEKPQNGDQSQSEEVKEEEDFSYIPVKEIILDDNGLKDSSFANILAALATQPSLKRLTYVNNELGARSIEQLEKILSNEQEGDLSDVRITNVKISKHDLN